ncbi:hypothetical protein ACOSQ3_032671 [Xanthoceras sorbifolium]
MVWRIPEGPCVPPLVWFPLDSLRISFGLARFGFFSDPLWSSSLWIHFGSSLVRGYFSIPFGSPLDYLRILFGQRFIDSVRGFCLSTFALWLHQVYKPSTKALKGFSLGMFALRSHQGHKFSTKALKGFCIETFALRSHQGHKPSPKALKGIFLRESPSISPRSKTQLQNFKGVLLRDFCPLIAPSS